MSVSQGYVFCGCITAAVVGVALLMIYMGVFRRGEAAELDDAAAASQVERGFIVATPRALEANPLVRTITDPILPEPASRTATLS